MFEKKCHIWGWILFIVCAVFFSVSSLKNEDAWALAASLIFMAACVIFLIPLIKSRNK